jgi:hypothetical protein
MMSEQPVRRMSAAEITSEAERHIDDYLDGGYDLEAKDIQAAVDAGVDPGVIAAIWAKAKTLRPSGPKPADFFSSALLPEDAPAAPAQPNPVPETDWAAERARREKALVAKPEGTLQRLLPALVAPKVDPEAQPEPQPEQPKVQLPAVVPLRPQALAAECRRWSNGISGCYTMACCLEYGLAIPAEPTRRTCSRMPGQTTRG